MKIDTYTKFLLTVIALCLVYLSLKDLIRVPKASADAPARVLLVDANNQGIIWNGGYDLPVLADKP
jgi:hypothetical protein